MGRTYIIIRTSFEALHHWPDCPFEDVDFLRSPHRHIFHVEVKIETFADRGIEFIRHKRFVDALIDDWYRGKNLGPKSCEVIAQELAEKLEASSVIVWEDLENAGIYEA